MSSSRFRKAITDVSAVFRHPRDILEAQDMALSEKVALLRQWDADMRLIMVASEENMTGAASGRPAEQLREIREALRQLGEATAAHAHPAPDKTGGG